MSIQRWNLNHYPQWPTAWEAHEDGDWVTYADHVAEVERVERVTRERVMQVTARAEHVAAEAMRAACLAAVEALLAEFPRDEYPVANSATWTALAALREVQP